MTKTCLKCGYTRTDSNSLLDADSCPSCGRFYAKMEAIFVKQKAKEVFVDAVDNPESNDNVIENKKNISLLLGIGILFMPIIFAWFAFRKDYSNKAQLI